MAERVWRLTRIERNPCPYYNPYYEYEVSDENWQHIGVGKNPEAALIDALKTLDIPYWRNDD